VSRAGSSRPPVVVILRSLSLGDLLVIVPPLRAIRRALPDAYVYLTAAPWTAPLARFCGLADDCVSSAPGIAPDPADIVALETGQLRSLAGVPPGPDLAVHFRGYRAATYQPLLRLRPRRLIAFRHPEVPASADGPVYVEHEHEVRRWSRLMSQSGIDCDPSELGITPPVVDLCGLGGSIVVHPGAGAKSRYWPVERWAAVIRRLCASGHKVAVTGGSTEAEWAGAIVAAAGAPPEVTDISGRTSILELTALIANAALVVCPDTGVGHLATAVGTRSVLLFGPADPAEWGPPPSPRHRVLWTGRRGNSYSDEPDPGLLELTEKDVSAAIEETLT
jgi:ADP-heptose:LPS heptosyltransferase